MAKKQTAPTWEGFLNPARLLTQAELEEYGETCAKCGATAHVVEGTRPLTDEEKQQSLDTLELSDLRYTCGLHAPIDVPERVLDDIDLEFYLSMKKPFICPEKRWEKYFSTCLRLKPACLKRCHTIKDRLHVSIAQASAMVIRGQAIEARRKKEKTHANTE
jgi:hypothetical protein